MGKEERRGEEEEREGVRDESGVKVEKEQGVGREGRGNGGGGGSGGGGGRGGGGRKRTTARRGGGGGDGEGERGGGKRGDGLNSNCFGWQQLALLPRVAIAAVAGVVGPISLLIDGGRRATSDHLVASNQILNCAIVIFIVTDGYGRTFQS